MKLKELLHGLDVLELHADETLDITGVHYDSRQVMRGGLSDRRPQIYSEGCRKRRSLHRLREKAGDANSLCAGF